MLPGLMPVEASAQAADIDWMWNLEVVAMSFLFALIVVPLVYSLIVFRRRKGRYDRCRTYGGKYQAGNRLDDHSIISGDGFCLYWAQ